MKKDAPKRGVFFKAHLRMTRNEAGRVEGESDRFFNLLCSRL